MSAAQPRGARHSGALQQSVISAAQRMLELGLVIGTTGNVSARQGPMIWITPTRASYETLDAGQLTAVDLAGVSGPHATQPSRELPLHLAAYGARRDIGAVIHTHSPYATAWSFLARPLEPRTEDLAYYDIGPVLTAPAAASGSEELAQGAAQGLEHANAVLLAGHGVVAVGESVEQALVRAQIVEFAARVAWLVLVGAKSDAKNS
jgi:ribulose-5-phosphate 4-epimerase/fuculose-1-phosphate aldolase